MSLEEKPAEVKPAEGNKKTPAERDSLIVKSKIKDYLHDKGCNASGEIVDEEGLNDIIKAILDKAVERAKANNRKTVFTKDL